MAENQESGHELGEQKINSALNALADFSVSKEVSEVINRPALQQQENNEVPAGNKAGETQENIETNVLSNTTTDTLPEPEQTGNSETASNEISIESDIFGGKKVIVAAEEKPAETQIENVEQLNSQIKTSLGFESFEELTGKVKAWQDQEKTFEEATQRLSNVEKLFELLPPELHQAVTAVANGQDWKKVLSETPSVDFRKGVEDYKPNELVEAFFPGNFSAEDWEEYNDPEGDPKIKKMINLLLDQSKDKFNQTKDTISNKATMSVQQAQKQQQAYDQSVLSTVGKLSSQVEGISDTYIKNVEKELKSPGAIAKLFYNEDGTLTEGGALAYVMAKDGFGLIEQYKKAVMRKTETEVNQDLLTRGSRVPTGNRGTASNGNEIRPEVQQELDRIRSLA